MNRQLFRLFMAIALIILLIFIVQLASVTVFSRTVVNNWTEVVFDEFASSLSIYVDEMEHEPAQSFFGFLTSSTNERISGFLLRSPYSSQFVSFGKSGKGNAVPQLNSFSATGGFQYIDENVSRSEKKSGTKVLDIDAPKYRLDLYTADPFSLIVVSGDFQTTGNEGKLKVSYPPTIEKNDIAGTIEVYVNDEIYAFLDVLVYSVDYYTPTSFILSEIYRTMLISIPMALVIALLFAYRVSRRTERNVRAIKDAVGKLSNGDFNPDLPAFRVQDYNEIGDSVKKLGSDLARHSASRKEWIRNISHDLNTPVTGMNMLLEGAQDGMFPIDDKLVDALKTECDTLKSRIASVAYYSYLLSPDAKCEKKECALLETSDLVLQSLHTPVRVSFPEGESVYGDVSLLSRAFSEILKNAVEYGEKDSPILWRSVRTDTSLMLVFTNHGHLPSPRPLFFEPWARGDASRTAGGSGLGLPIVYQIMELHGGSVSIDEEDGYVQVILSFPLS